MLKSRKIFTEQMVSLFVPSDELCIGFAQFAIGKRIFRDSTAAARRDQRRSEPGSVPPVCIQQGNPEHVALTEQSIPKLVSAAWTATAMEDMPACVLSTPMVRSTALPV